MLVVRALGGLTIEVDEQPIRLTARVDEALLVYLIAHSRPVPRETLVALLWQESDPKQANNNFRSALSRLRRSVGAYLTVTRQAVGFDHAQPHQFDAAQFETQMEALIPHLDQAQPLAPDAAERLVGAMALYQGDFLAGFGLRGGSAEFDTWCLLLQERLRTLAAAALRRLTRHALHTGQWTSGLQFAARLIRLDPLDETAHQLKMRLHLRNRDRSAALRQYAACRQILGDELGVEPLPSTRALFHQLRAATPHAHNLPAAQTPLVGRTAAVSAAFTALLAPHSRLVTVTGIGGIGKTRVAVATARRFIGRLRDGVTLVPLIGLDHPDALAQAAADALGIGDRPRQGGRRTVEGAVVDHLRDREALLLFDNYEQLLRHADATRLIEQLLQQAPDVRLLVTSREALQLSEETIIALDGLEADAAAFFHLHATRIRGRPLPAADAAQVVDLCRLLAGVPLALELAAGATRSRSVGAVGAEIRASLDALQSKRRNVPARQQSLRSAFNYSWSLLTEPLRERAARLALFVGDFSGEAAAALNVEADALDALVAKSLLQSLPDDRFALHPLIRAYADEKLDGPARHAAVGRFGAYYTETFVRWAKGLGRNLTQPALDAWRRDGENVVQAWRLAIAARDVDVLLRLNTPLGVFHNWRNRYEAAERLYAEAATALAEWGAADGRPLEAYGDILLRRAWFVYVQGRIAEALSLMEQAEPVIRRGGSRQSLEIWQRALLQMVVKAGDFARGQALASTLLAHSDPARDPGNHANRLYDSFHVFAATGEYEQARQLVTEALEIFQELGDRRRVLMCQYALGNLARAQGEYARAVPILRRCLAGRRDLEDDRSVANTQSTLADALCALGDLDEAQALAEAACVTYATLDDKIGWPYPLNVLGNVARARGDNGLAVAHYQQALAMAVETDRQMKVAELLLDWLLLREDDLAPDFFLGSLVALAALEAAEYEIRRRARQHLQRRTREPHPPPTPWEILLAAAQADDNAGSEDGTKGG